MTALSRHNPFTPPLPFQLRECLTMVVSSDTIYILSTSCVDSLIDAIITSCLMAIEGRECLDGIHRMIATTIENGSVLTTFSWMPHEWLIPTRTPTITHTVSVVQVTDESDGETNIARLEPFLGIAHRSMDVFDEISSTLATIYSLRSNSVQNTQIQVNYTFLHREFRHFTTLGETDDEVKNILAELCSTMEFLQAKSGMTNETTRRESIVGPGVERVKDRQATNTSARVDRTAKPPSTKTVEKHQATTTGRSQRGKARRRHTCPVCLKEGHHSKTCVDVLSEENFQRADAFSGTSSGRTKHKSTLPQWRRVFPWSFPKGLPRGSSRLPRHE